MASLRNYDANLSKNIDFIYVHLDLFAKEYKYIT